MFPAPKADSWDGRWLPLCYDTPPPSTPSNQKYFWEAIEAHLNYARNGSKNILTAFVLNEKKPLLKDPLMPPLFMTAMPTFISSAMASAMKLPNWHSSRRHFGRLPSMYSSVLPTVLFIWKEFMFLCHKVKAVGGRHRRGRGSGRGRGSVGDLEVLSTRLFRRLQSNWSTQLNSNATRK